jgi:hypothetical protein
LSYFIVVDETLLREERVCGRSDRQQKAIRGGKRAT